MTEDDKNKYIEKERNELLKELDHIQEGKDDEISPEELAKIYQEKQKQFIDEIKELGDIYVEQIEEKERNFDDQTMERIHYIRKKFGDKYGSVDYLQCMDYDQLHELYLLAKKEKTGFDKFISSIMGWS